MEYEQPWNMGKVLLEFCEVVVRKARSPHHFAYQKSNASFPVFPVPNKCIFIWGAMFGHTCFYKEMWFKYEKKNTSVNKNIYLYIYVCVVIYVPMC